MTQPLPAFRRPLFHLLRARLLEPRRFLQVLWGPRQAGKTTLVQQVAAELDLPFHYASADFPGLQNRMWLEQQWEMGRRLAREGPPPPAGQRAASGRQARPSRDGLPPWGPGGPAGSGAVLILDEVQKVQDWSAVVKGLWDEDTRQGLPLRVVVLGSAPVLVQKGLAESLAGRFEVIRVGHWSFQEMQQAFGWGLDTFLYFGGYPGSAWLVEDEARWERYVLDSLVETTLSRDLLLHHRVEKPALLRQLFELARRYSGEVLSYQKMLGQLQDAGNTVTLAHYLHLLGQVWMVKGLEKFSGSEVRRRGSSPKLQVMNMALASAGRGLSFQQVRADPERWGRWVESAVGAHLANLAETRGWRLMYWRDRGREVDYVVDTGSRLTALEVRSGGRPKGFEGLEAFRRAFGPHGVLVVGQGGLTLEEFFVAGAEVLE